MKSALMKDEAALRDRVRAILRKTPAKSAEPKEDEGDKLIESLITSIQSLESKIAAIQTPSIPTPIVDTSGIEALLSEHFTKTSEDDKEEEDDSDDAVINKIMEVNAAFIKQQDVRMNQFIKTVSGILSAPRTIEVSRDYQGNITGATSNIVTSH